MKKKSFLISLVCAAALMLSSCGGGGSALEIFTFDGKPVSQLLGSSINEVINVMGEYLGSGADDRDVIHRLDYDGIHLWFDDGIFVRAESFEVSDKLAIDGVSLNKNRAEIIEALGKPESESQGEGLYGDEDAYEMVFHLSNCVIFLEFGADLSVPPSMINIQRKQ